MIATTQSCADPESSTYGYYKLYSKFR